MELNTLPVFEQMQGQFSLIFALIPGTIEGSDSLQTIRRISADSITAKVALDRVQDFLNNVSLLDFHLL